MVLILYWKCALSQIHNDLTFSFFFSYQQCYLCYGATAALHQLFKSAESIVEYRVNQLLLDATRCCELEEYAWSYFRNHRTAERVRAFDALVGKSFVVWKLNCSDGNLGEFKCSTTSYGFAIWVDIEHQVWFLFGLGSRPNLPNFCKPGINGLLPAKPTIRLKMQAWWCFQK